MVNDKLYEIAENLGLKRSDVETFCEQHGKQATLTLLDFCTKSVRYFIQDESKSIKSKEKDHAETT